MGAEQASMLARSNICQKVAVPTTALYVGAAMLASSNVCHQVQHWGATMLYCAWGQPYWPIALARVCQSKHWCPRLSSSASMTMTRMTMMALWQISHFASHFQWHLWLKKHLEMDSLCYIGKRSDRISFLKRLWKIIHFPHWENRVFVDLFFAVFGIGSSFGAEIWHTCLCFVVWNPSGIAESAEEIAAMV